MMKRKICLNVVEGRIKDIRKWYMGRERERDLFSFAWVFSSSHVHRVSTLSRDSIFLTQNLPIRCITKRKHGETFVRINFILMHKIDLQDKS